MARKNSSGSALLFLILLGFGALLAIPKEVWITLGVVGVLGLVVFLFIKALIPKPTPGESTPNQLPSVEISANRPIQRMNHEKTQIDSGVVVRPPERTSTGFQIPKSPAYLAPPRWYGRDEIVTIAGRKIAGGLFYMGNQVEANHGESDPSLINLSKSVGRRGDYRLRLTDYWPSYSNISSEARAAYLDWLADGRRDPEADIGYVFLFFYGLERRVIIDSRDNSDVSKEFPEIRREIEELLAVYGEKSNSFAGYAGRLLALLMVSASDEPLYLLNFPWLPKAYEVPLVLKVALGQAAMGEVPLASRLALAWASCNPACYLRTPATRCPEEFERLFDLGYRRKFGAGMVLPKNKTKINASYQAASSALGRYGQISVSAGDLPDVTILTKPVAELQALVEETTGQLEAYSRFLGKNPDARGTLAASLLLPFDLWPDQLRSVIRDLKGKTAEGFHVAAMSEFLGAFGLGSMLQKDRFLDLLRILESEGIAFEPHVLSGAKIPKLEDPVVLFSLEESAQPLPDTAYRSAVLTLQFASVVAIADGEFGSIEFTHLRGQIEDWCHLAPVHRKRLHAHLHLLQKAPISMASLKKQIESLDTASKETIAIFLAGVANADGTVSVEEMKLLEKIYAVLGLDSKRLFSDIHSAAAGTPPGNQVAKVAEGRKFALDATRIQALQRDTEHVNQILSKIFVDQEPEPVAAVQVDPADDEETPSSSTNFMNLDDAHSSFARHLMSRSEWTRSELQDTASDLDLMLDGALEQINEASFDAYDLPFTEGEDPISVNPEIMEKIAA